MQKIYTILIIIAFSLPALADYHYASHTGSNTYPYTSWETAADSIQKAINSGTAGDTIYVGSGVWEDAPYTLWNGLSLIGRGIDSTTIRMGNHSGWINSLTTYSHVRIQDFTFDGTNFQYASSGVKSSLGEIDIALKDNKFINWWVGVQMSRNTGQITNNIIFNCKTAIDASFDACSLLVKNNTISGCTEEGIFATDGNWTVTNNLFYNNPGNGSMISLVFYRVSDTCYVANNLFYNNQWSPNLQSHVIALYGEGVVNNTFIGPNNLGDQRAMFICALNENNVLWSKNNYITHFYAAFGISSIFVRPQLDISYTDLWRNDYDYVGDPADVNYLEGNLRADAMFADSTDFYLQAFSPLIDAGDPNILDVDGTMSDIGYLGGPGGRSYEYLDLSPAIPDSISAQVAGDTVRIGWRFNTEADFNRYKLFRDTISAFTPSVFNLIAEPESSLFVDIVPEVGSNYYYMISAIDNQENMSDYSAELAVIFTGVNSGNDPNLAKVTDIETNYPNPFNSRTIIDYYLADVGYQPAEVKLNIYNIAGQLVRELVHERQYPGRHSIIWDGRGSRGEELSSGVYFARLIVSDLELRKPRKLILLK